MQLAEAKKTSTANNQKQARRQPFFNKEGQDSFFSKSNEATTSFFSPTTIQPKLTIGQPNDKYEVEADAMADKVVQRLSKPSNEEPASPAMSTNNDIQAKCSHFEEENVQKKEENLSKNKLEIRPKPIFESNGEQPEANIQAKPLATNVIQSKCSSCVEEEKLQKKEEEEVFENGLTLQRKSNDTPSESDTGLESGLSSSKGGGSSLPTGLQTSMGSEFGADFSNVRVHTGSDAVQMSQDIGAQAFTHGSDIYFNQGKYNTDSSSGKHLLAHELTHTLQQGLGKSNVVQRYCDPSTATCPTSEPINTSEDFFRQVLRRYPILMSKLSRDELVELSNSGSTVDIELQQLMNGNEKYVEADLWERLDRLLPLNPAPQMLSGSIRNEIVKRFFEANGLNLNDVIEITSNTNNGLNLTFSMGGSTVNTNRGIIELNTLDELISSNRLDDIINDVGNEVTSFERAFNVKRSADGLASSANSFSRRVENDFAGTSIATITGRLSAMREIKQSADSLEERAAHLPAGFASSVESLTSSIETINDVLTQAELFHSQNQPEITNQELYDDAGTGTVQWAADHWEAGNYVRGGVGYSGAFVLAMFDGLGNLVTFGYQGTEGQVTTAYRRGQISHDDMESLNDDAFTRSMVVGVATVALMIATAGLGSAAAGGLGLAKGTLGASMVSQGVAGGTFMFGAMTTESLTTRAMNDYGDTYSGALWMQQAHSPGEIAMGTGGGLVLGAALGGAPFALDFVATRTAIYTDMQLANRLATTAARGSISEAELLALQESSGFVRRISHQWLEERGYQMLYRGQGVRTDQILSPIAQREGLAASEQLVKNLRAAGLTEEEIAGYTAVWNFEPVPAFAAPPSMANLPLGSAGIPTSPIPNVAAQFATGEGGVLYILRVPRKLAIPVGTNGWGNMSVVEQEHIIFHQISDGNIVRVVPRGNIVPLQAVPNETGVHELIRPR